MPASQDNISFNTPIGANLITNGASFKVWAPGAIEVYICGDFNNWQRKESSKLIKDSKGYWTGFVPNISDGAQYKFYVKGKGGESFKRDPYARELSLIPAYPKANCILRDPEQYKWHDQTYITPPFNDLIIYQFHIGTFFGSDRKNRVAKFLDVLDRIDYLTALGINAIEPLPISEFASPRSLGYDGSDLFSPEMDYFVEHDQLHQYEHKINELLSRKDQNPITADQLKSQINQLKILIDICHLYDIAVIFDLVFNHAGGDIKNQDESLWFFDNEEDRINDNNSLYFTDQNHTGPVFAFWKKEVRQFLIDNAAFYIHEYHIDGIRFDQVSVIVKQNVNDGWVFCRDLTDTVRLDNPKTIQIAEFWNVNPWIIKPNTEGGAGFDSTWHDGLRESIRNAISQASNGANSFVDLDRIAANLYPAGFSAAWKAVQYLESHDEVYTGRAARIPSLADPGNSRSWYARSRARTALGIILTAPGIPMLFMGEEFLEDKRWSDNPEYNKDTLIWWEGLDQGDKSMVDYLRFSQELIKLRRNNPSLRSDNINIYHVNNSSRIIAYHRWHNDLGNDIIAVISLNDFTNYEYNLGFPRSGAWEEIFNSDIYDNWVNPQGAGNGGRIFAQGIPAHNLPASAKIIIPANSILVFTFKD